MIAIMCTCPDPRCQIHGEPVKGVVTISPEQARPYSPQLLFEMAEELRNALQNGWLDESEVPRVRGTDLISIFTGAANAWLARERKLSVRLSPVGDEDQMIEVGRIRQVLGDLLTTHNHSGDREGCRACEAVKNANALFDELSVDEREQEAKDWYGLTSEEWGKVPFSAREKLIECMEHQKSVQRKETSE